MFLAASAGFALETASYVNDAASLPIGARTAAMAGVGLGMPGDPSHLAVSPAGLVDVTRPEVVFHHASLYEGLSLSQDEIYLAAPLSYGTVGLGVSRVGADGILRAERGQTPDFANPSTFAATDWLVSVGFARTWFDRHLQAGAALRLLGRDIDGEYGGGTQLDASAVWVQNGWRAGLKLDRGVGGLATWESGRTEYASPDLVAGVGYERRLPYFYGRGAMAWETPGLLQKQASSTFSAGDARLWSDPWLFLRSSRLGGEFRFDMGLVLRVGCEIQSLTRALDFLQGDDQEGQFGDSRGSISVGAGYLWANRVRLDYALVSHPDLGNTQRFSIALVFGGTAPKPVTEMPEAPAPPRSERPFALDTSFAAPSDSASRVSPLDSVRSDSSLLARSADSLVAPVSVPAPGADSLRPAATPQDTATVPVSAPQPATPDSVATPIAAPVTTPASAPEPTPVSPATITAPAPEQLQPAPAVPAAAKPVPAPKPSLPPDEWDAPEQQAP